MHMYKNVSTKDFLIKYQFGQSNIEIGQKFLITNFYHNPVANVDTTITCL